jgi:hypothetical protein
MDVTPWNHWRVPVIPNGLSLGLESGPVLVTVEYNVDPTHVNDFLKPCIVINGSVVATERRAGGFIATPNICASTNASLEQTARSKNGLTSMH